MATVKETAKKLGDPAPSAIPVINAANPVVVAPVTTPGQTYDKFRVATLVTQQFNANGPISIGIELVQYGLLADGVTKVDHPGPSIPIKISDLEAAIAKQADGSLAQAFGAVLIAVISVAKEQGLVS